VYLAAEQVAAADVVAGRAVVQVVLVAVQAEAAAVVPLRQRLQPIPAACMALAEACVFQDD